MTALVLLAATAIATVFHLMRSALPTSRHPLPYYLPPHHEQHIRTVPLNRTLGFEKIYVLSLPHRDDRHDEFSLLSSAYGFDVERVDGVRPDEMWAEGQPVFDEDVTRTEQACWRAHVRIWRKMVEEGVESAMMCVRTRRQIVRCVRLDADHFRPFSTPR